MMDELATYDWRELRTKTLEEIRIHRGLPERKPGQRKKLRQVVHYKLGDEAICGRQRKYTRMTTLDTSKVECGHCINILKKAKNGGH